VSLVPWSICVLGTPVSPAKIAEPIEMPFGDRLVWSKGTWVVREEKRSDSVSDPFGLPQQGDLAIPKLHVCRSCHFPGQRVDQFHPENSLLTGVWYVLLFIYLLCWNISTLCKVASQRSCYCWQQILCIEPYASGLNIWHEATVTRNWSRLWQHFSVLNEIVIIWKIILNIIYP